MKSVSVVPKSDCKTHKTWKVFLIRRMKVRYQLLETVSINFDKILNYEQNYDLENLTLT